MKKETFYGASPLLFERAKELRDRMTGAEYTLWQYLKKKQLGVVRFTNDELENIKTLISNL